MLKDLSQLIDECRSKFDSFPFTSDIEIKPNFAEKLESIGSLLVLCMSIKKLSS